MRQDVFRVAYEEASSELLDITVRFEQLKQRKIKLEGVVAAMATLVGRQIPQPPSPTAREVVEAKPEAPQQAELSQSDSINYTFNQVPVPLPELEETGGDPFQRRVKNALRFGVLSPGKGLQPAV